MLGRTGPPRVKAGVGGAVGLGSEGRPAKEGQQVEDNKRRNSKGRTAGGGTAGGGTARGGQQGEEQQREDSSLPTTVVRPRLAKSLSL